MEFSFGNRTDKDYGDFVNKAISVCQSVEAGFFYKNPNFMCPGCPYRKFCFNLESEDLVKAQLVDRYPEHIEM